MRNRNKDNNVFINKFHLLNSQEHSDEINWSSSSASDYEDTSYYKFSHQDSRKRKRKKKVLKNISNLSIKILDTSKENRKDACQEKSPILNCRNRQKNRSSSPILNPIQSSNGAKVTSPILTSRTMHLKSPILAPKTGSPKQVVKVRKKLFNVENIKENVHYVNLHKNTEQEEIDVAVKIEVDGTDECDIAHQNVVANLEELATDNSVHENMTKAKIGLAMRVKSFFDSHFSSENTSVASQNSISEILTPKNSTKTSDEIEIFTCKSEVMSNNNSNQSLKQDNSTNSSENSLYNFNKNMKKIKYKKNGLACRLNNLLKKQNASLSLWRHERFLAANSNFVIPKGQFSMFRIQKVCIKYGCHLLQAVNMNNDTFLILINSLYVSDSIVSETVLKLYEPFNILQYNDDCKLIINVIKFECRDYKS